MSIFRVVEDSRIVVEVEADTWRDAKAHVEDVGVQALKPVLRDSAIVAVDAADGSALWEA